jgi:hypothetical protein
MIPKDKLFDLVCKVYDSMHALYNKLHYLSCERALGRHREKGN